MPIRYDATTIGAFSRTPQGGIRVDAKLTRTGIFEYKNPDGSTRRELRPAEEVFRADSLAQMRGIPVVVGHRGLVGPDNWKEQTAGHVGDDVRQDGEFVAASLVIQRPDAVSGVSRKELTETSVGYEIDFDPTPGEIEGKRFDGVQRNIRPNHLALIPKGRARGGSECQLRLDSKGDEVIHYTNNGMTPEEIAAALVKAREEAAAQARMDSKSEADKITAERDVLKGKVAELTAQLADSTRLDALVVERSEILAAGSKFVKGFSAVKADKASKTNREIKSEIVAARSPSMRLDGKSDDYIEAAFRMALDVADKEPSPGLGKLRTDAVDAQTPSVGGLAAAAKRNSEASQNAWKSPLSATNGT